MSILFHKIRWKNFLSTGNAFTEIDLQKNKATLIVGKNGAGKSTLLDAISFSLYNKPFRKINKPQLINSINNKDCVVEIEFSTGGNSYTVIRGIKPTRFEIYKNDNLISQESANKDYQLFLETQILKMNHRSFCQVVVLGSSTYVPFMQLAAAHRREIIEDILDLQIFSTMNTLLKEKIATNKTDIQENKYAINLYKEKFEMQEKLLFVVNRDSSARIQDNKKKMSTLAKNIIRENDSMVKTNEKIKNFAEVDSQVNTISSEMNNLASMMTTINVHMKNITKSVGFFEKNEHCPTCLQDIEADFKHNHLQELLDDYEKNDGELKQLQAQYEELEQNKKELVKVQEQIKSLQGEINVRKQNIKNYKLQFSSLQREVEELQASKKNDSEEEVSKLDSLKNKLLELESNREALVNQQSILSMASVLLKDGGIKSKIIKQYIPIINKLINKYLSSMDFFVHFELDEQFNEKIKSRFRDEFSYNSFSEGEKFRINLAILFTWRAIAKMRNSASTNLLLMDEVFDSSLDSNGTDEFLTIIKNLTSDTNTFIISHKGDQLLDKFEDVIRFEKYGNFSRIM
jgi:DNA repair exonuclease SbcCD ATPase subunit